MESPLGSISLIDRWGQPQIFSQPISIHRSLLCPQGNSTALNCSGSKVGFSSGIQVSLIQHLCTGHLEDCSEQGEMHHCGNLLVEESIVLPLLFSQPGTTHDVTREAGSSSVRPPPPVAPSAQAGGV